MRISIAMATYNGEKYLQEQLDSLLNQTRLPDEIIISDDCSQDGTLHILERFAETAPFEVKVLVNEKNLGYAGNYNRALCQTTGDLVFLCDQDDVWFPEKISHIENIANNDSKSLVFMNDASLTDVNLCDQGLTKVGQIRSAGFRDSAFVMGCCSAIRRKLLNICLPIPEEVNAHDTWIMYFADGLGHKHIEEAVLQYYRRHGSNESQFIVNRLTKITRRHVMYHRLQRLVARVYSNGIDGVSSARFQLCIVQRTLRIALEKNGGISHITLISFLSKVDSEIIQLDARLDVRSGWFPARVFRSIRHWVRGGYQKSRGFEDVIRDVLLM